MGLATMPSAPEGVLCIILVNTALPVRYLIRALLCIIGVHLDSAFTSVEPSSSAGDDQQDSNRVSYLEEFRTQRPAVRFGSICKKMKKKKKKKKIRGEAKEDDSRAEEGGQLQDDCLVCLNGFEPESEINHLSCGHMFHKTCLEQWVDYWNITCPLCRTPLIISEEEDTAHCLVE